MSEGGGGLGTNASPFSYDEQLVEGVRVTEKLLGLRALFGFKIANPIYHSVPPKGFFLNSKISAALETDEDGQHLRGCCDELQAEIINFRRHLGLDDNKVPTTAVINLLDTLRPTQSLASSLDRSVSYKFQQFRIAHSEENYTQESWNPMEMKDYPKTCEFIKVHLQPTLRHNPLLKKHVRKNEVADLDLHRLVMKRFAVKSAQSTGLRSKPASQRAASKQRDLKFEIIPELVNFMPKLASYTTPSSTPKMEDDNSSLSEVEVDASDNDSSTTTTLSE